MSRADNYEAHRQRAAEFVNQAVTTALLEGPPPADNEPPNINHGWQDGPYEGQEQFIRTAIEQFKKHAPGISPDTPAADFAVWPPGRVYSEAARLSRWNKSSSNVQSSMAMFKVRHALWRFIAAAIVYRKRLMTWPIPNWPAPESFLQHPNTEVRHNKFLELVHSWSDSYLRMAGIIR